MRIYRAVSLDEHYWSELEGIWKDGGASKYGGRWNVMNQRAIYCSSEAKCVLAEKGYYEILSKITSHQINKNNPKASFDLIIDIKTNLIELEAQSLKILDLTNQEELNKICKDLGLSIKVSDYRKSAYLAFKPRYTQLIGKEAQRIGFNGIKVLSARSNHGHNIVLYPETFEAHQLNILKTETIYLSAVDSKGKKLKMKNSPVVDRILATNKNLNMLIDVTIFK